MPYGQERARPWAQGRRLPAHLLPPIGHLLVSYRTLLAFMELSSRHLMTCKGGARNHSNSTIICTISTLILGDYHTNESAMLNACLRILIFKLIESK